MAGTRTPIEPTSKKNRNGEETSARTYARYIPELLEEWGGVTPKEEVYAAVKARYGKTYGPSDLRRMRGRKEPKWRNQVAWALVVLRKSDTIRTVGKMVFLLGQPTNPKLIAWALKVSQRKRSFKKTCPQCRLAVPLSRKVCPECGHRFTPTTRKVDR